MEKGSCEARRSRRARQPHAHATTRALLEKFGLRSTADLPDLDQFAPDDDTRAFIRERLSATREDAFVADDARLDGDEADPLTAPSSWTTKDRGASRKVRARKRPPTRLSRCSPRLWPAGSGSWRRSTSTS
ncbi:MAG: hypothetical protein ACLSVD_10795 [Eggerthellaceae bacterium]